MFNKITNLLENMNTNIKLIENKPDNVQILSDSKLTVYLLRKKFKRKNIHLNTNVKGTDLEVHSSSQYSDILFEYHVSSSPVVAITSLFKI